MKRICRLLPVLVFTVLGVLPAPAQTSARNSGGSQTAAPDILPTVPSPSPGYPPWVQDLRRGEIVAFGSFPLTMFFSTFAMDSIRFFTHDKNKAYLPWPLKGPGAIEMSREEKGQTLMIAAAASVTIAIIDFVIVKAKQRRERNRDHGDIRVTHAPVIDNNAGAAADSPGIAPEDP